MMNTRTLRIFCIGVGLTLLLVGLVPFVFAQDATPQAPVVTEEPTETQDSTDAATPEEGAPTGNNSYCAICHAKPQREITLADGYVLNLHVTPAALEGSVHSDLGCVDCHGEDAFPHNDPTPTDNRTYTLDAVQACESCHDDHAADLADGLHQQAISEGNIQAAVCTDCHGAHDVQRVDRAPQLVANICADCHVATVSEWRVSPHVGIGTLGCSTCHTAHTQVLRGGFDANGQCINCHKVMPEQWVHTQHLGLAYGDNEVGCVDCHMYTSPHGDGAQTVSTWSGTMPSGHSMNVDTASCTDCHENAGDLPVTRVESPITTTPRIIGSESPSTLIKSNVSEPEREVEAVQAESFIPLLQGLIVGLGLGATGAAIFVARGNRRQR